MFPIFTTAWALAILFHLATPQGGGRSLASFLLFAAAIAAVFWPAFSLSLLALSVLQIVQFWGRLPRAQTSEYFKFICGLCLLLTYVELSLAQSTLLVEPKAWLRAALPVLRFALCLLFFASVLHKLNLNFLKPEVSVAPGFFNPLLELFGLPKYRWAQHAAPYVTLAVESFIAIGLLFPVTRLLALAVLLLFFFVVGLEGIVQFSSLIYASALLFFDERAFGTVLSQHPGLLASPGHVAFGIGCLLFFSASFVFRRGLVLLVLGVSLLSGLVLFVAARLVLASRDALWSAPMFPLLAAQVVLLVLFLLNELGPHIGYKDWPTFRMYSNLKTGISGNHLFLRPLFIPFFKSRDEVMITAATRAALYGNSGDQSDVFYVPYRSLAAMARHRLRHPPRGAGDELRQIEYVRQNAWVSEDIASFGRQGRSWLDFVLPSRFFYQFPAPHPAGKVEV